MRRMKEMAQFQPGMSFYGELPDSYSLTLNTEHPLIKKVIDDAVKATESDLKPLDEELKATNNVISALRDLKKDDKELTDEQKKDLEENEKKAGELRDKRTAAITNYAAGQDVVKQLIDIALLGNGLLKGESLNAFLKRSVSLLK